MAIEWDGLADISAIAAAKSAAVDAACAEYVADGALMVEAASMAESPVETGTLRRSHVMVGPVNIGDAWMAATYPTIIYSRRVHQGFHGPDSLGRVYDQDGNPFLARGAEMSGEELRSLWVERMTEATSV